MQMGISTQWLAWLAPPRSWVLRRPRTTLALLVLCLLALPATPLGTPFIMHVSILVMLYMILALGLNVVPGFTGLLDLGFVGFYGIGAYTAGLLTLRFAAADGLAGWLGSYWVILPLAALNGALWGMLLGAPTLRLTGDYFAIVTFGFSELVVLVITNETWLTRGPMGLPGIAPPSLGGYTFRGNLPMYYLIFVMVCATVFVMVRLSGSRLGRAWYAIREDQVAAQACGINILTYKVIAFAVSAAFGAAAGSFFARWLQFISPNMFKFWESIFILCMIVLGGMGSIGGTLLGAALLISLSEALRSVLPPSLVGARHLLFGLILILIMRFRPGGLVPIYRQAAPATRRRRRRAAV